MQNKRMIQIDIRDILEVQESLLQSQQKTNQMLRLVTNKNQQAELEKIRDSITACLRRLAAISGNQGDNTAGYLATSAAEKALLTYLQRELTPTASTAEAKIVLRVAPLFVLQQHAPDIPTKVLEDAIENITNILNNTNQKSFFKVFEIESQ